MTLEGTIESSVRSSKGNYRGRIHSRRRFGGYGTRPQGNRAVGWGDLRMTLVYQVFIMVLVQGA